MKRYGKYLVVAVLILIVWLWRWPPRPWLNLTKRVNPTAECGAALVVKYNCRQCHRIGGSGGLVAPNLQGITQRVDDPAHVTLRLWLQNPKAVKPTTAMPNFHLSDYEIDAIVAYLEALDRGENPAPGDC